MSEHVALSKLELKAEVPFQAAFSDIIEHLGNVTDDAGAKILGDVDWGLNIFEQSPHEDAAIVARLWPIQDEYEMIATELIYGWQNLDLAIFFGAYIRDRSVNIELQWRRVIHRLLRALQVKTVDHPEGLPVNTSKYQFRRGSTISRPEDTWKGARGLIKLNPGWTVRRVNIPMRAWVQNFPS